MVLMQKRYFIELAYKGTNYHGWQSQKNSVAVQSVLENALRLLVKGSKSLTGAGRTDTGVHASYYVAHFDASQIEKLPELVIKLNRFLPSDIAVFNIQEMPAEAHARFDAVSRTYKYFITTHKEVFAKDFCNIVSREPDMEAMNCGAKFIASQTDFTTFSKLHSDNKTNICHIEKAVFSRQGNFIIFEITADRFLRNMVRAITASLLSLGLGKITLEELKTIAESKERGLVKGSATARGLFLTDIRYPAAFALSRVKINYFR